VLTTTPAAPGVSVQVLLGIAICAKARVAAKKTRVLAEPNILLLVSSVRRDTVAAADSDGLSLEDRVVLIAARAYGASRGQNEARWTCC